MTMNIFAELRNDHDKQRSLIKMLMETSGDTKKREELFQRLKSHLSAHAAAEEKHFYALLMRHDITVETGRHSVAEHKELDDYMEQLEQADPAHSSWLAIAKKLEDRLLHHLEEEEREVFQLAGKALNDDQKVELAKSYRMEMDGRNEAA